MQKITSILFILLFGYSSILVAQRHPNPGQDRSQLVPKLDPLNTTEIGYARTEMTNFQTDYDFGCPDGFSFSRVGFAGMLTSLGITGECKSAQDSCYGIRIYPAFDGSSMYLVFIGETYENVTNGHDHPVSMNNKSYFTLKSLGSGGSTDLVEIAPSHYLRASVESDILTYKNNYSVVGEFNMRSLSFTVGEYNIMLAALDADHPPVSGKFYSIRLRPAYNPYTSSTNKLYMVANEEEITVRSGGGISRLLLESKFYNHMDPCPKKCPDVELVLLREAKAKKITAAQKAKVHKKKTK
jgi:hypothetical protein